MKALVTGGAGFIGSHLCDALLERGIDVIAADNFLTGSRENVAHLLEHPGFALLDADVSHPLDLEPDVIFHLASPASPSPYSQRSYLAHPVATALVNSVGTYHLLELARRRNARFLLASTSEVYGDPLVHPQAETYWGNVNPIGPRACYDESKRFAEALTMTYVRHHGVDARIVRIFNTYGPRMDPDDGRVVPNFIMQALRGEPMTIYGDGTQTRSLGYVADLVEGLLLAMFTDGIAGEVFNLGNPDERTIREYAELIRELCGSSSPLAFYPLPPDDPARRCPDISRARERLGWEPRTDVREGLARTVDWFRSHVLLGERRRS